MNKKYHCEFPECKFCTEDRDRIDYHHIIPKSWPESTNKPKNMIWLCPDHHRAVYIPGMTHGHHSIINDDSVVIIDKIRSNRGYVLRYRKCSDMVLRYFDYYNKISGIDWEEAQLDLWGDPNNYYEIIL